MGLAPIRLGERDQAVLSLLSPTHFRSIEFFLGRDQLPARPDLSYSYTFHINKRSLYTNKCISTCQERKSINRGRAGSWSLPQKISLLKCVSERTSLNGCTICLACEKSDRKAVPKRTTQPSFFVTAKCDGHHDNVSIRRKKKKEHMAKTYKVPTFVHLGNILTLTLLRTGFKLRGPFVFFGNYPMYLLTVRGRKSGQPRTVAVAMIERNGKRYVGSPYGIVDWVRNLRAAGEAVLTRGRRSETINARELPKGEAALVLREEIKGGNPFGRYFGVTADSSLEEFERAAVAHPVFVLERK